MTSKITGSQLSLQPPWPAALSSAASASAAATSAADRLSVAAAVYRAMARATGYSSPRTGHCASTAAIRTMTPNTGPGQTRRSDSTRTVRTATTRLTASAVCAGFAVWAKENSPNDATAASRAQPMSKAQERSGRVPGFSTGVQKDIFVSSQLLGVLAVQAPGGRRGEHDRVPAQHREPGPRAQQAPGAQRVAPQGTTRVGWQVAGELLDRVREGPHDDRHHEEHRGEHRQARGGLAEQAAKGQAD